MERRRSKRKKTTSAAPPHLVEVTLVAYYPSPWKNDAEEVAALAQDRWHPTSKDFYAVAHTPNQGRRNATIVREVNNVNTFFGAIKYEDCDAKKERPNGSIGRLNLISHGGKGVFSLSGTVRSNGLVFTGRGSENHMIDEMIDDDTLEWFNQDAYGKQCRDEIRAKLNPKAELWLILCNAAGLGPSHNLSRRLAKTFNVTVRAYNKEVWYYPDQANPQNQIRCPIGAIACLNGRNLTSVGRDDPPKEHSEKGRGYFCQVKVPHDFAGTHMRNAERISPEDMK